jgi:hypothetical protein
MRWVRFGHREALVRVLEADTPGSFNGMNSVCCEIGAQGKAQANTIIKYILDPPPLSEGAEN